MAIHYNPEDIKPDVFEERAILSIHEAKRREIWKGVFLSAAPFRTLHDLRVTSDLASQAVLDFDEFFRTHPS